MAQLEKAAEKDQEGYISKIFESYGHMEQNPKNCKK
jgi:hypothetical protein